MQNNKTKFVLDILPEFSAIQQIESIEAEEWSHSPERITKGFPSAYADTKESNQELKWRRLTLENMQDRKRKEIEKRRDQYVETIERRRESKLLRDQQASAVAEQIRKDTQRKLDKLWQKRQDQRRKNYLRQLDHNHALERRRHRQALRAQETRDDKTQAYDRRLSEHKFELNWRKKKLHQNTAFLDFVNSMQHS